MTLAEFLLARIAEDAEVARAAIDDHFWVKRGSGSKAHIWRWQPDRVLTECYAKRRIVELHARAPWIMSGRPVCGHDETTWPCADLRLLALPYVDHPDYQPEWKP